MKTLQVIEASLRKDFHCLPVQVKMSLDDLKGRESHPLIQSDGDDAAATPRKLLEVFARKIQMLHHQLGRKVTQPLGKRDLFVSAGTEHFQNCRTSLPVFST